MNIDFAREHIVIVNGGSGVIMQPMTEKYSYILTVKHNFSTPLKLEQLVRFKLNNGVWQKIRIELEDFMEGDQYFPHPDKDKDIAIIKIPTLRDLDNSFRLNDISTNKQGFHLVGYPETRRKGNENKSDWYRRDDEVTIKDPKDNGQYEANVPSNPTLEEIRGHSGGGLIKIISDQLFIAGIQNRMAEKNEQLGNIRFTPIFEFDAIVDHYKHSGQLTQLNLPFMGTFDFLRDEAFELKVDFINESKVESTRIHLRNKALEVIGSDMTPIAIKDLFQSRLLIDESEKNCLDSKNIWVGWLEFLTIINIVKSLTISIEDLNSIFNQFRLKYTHAEDCTTLFQDHLSKSDYFGLKQGSTVIINSKLPPREPFYLPQGIIKNITKPQDKRGFRTDAEIDPFQSFNFIHLDYFKTKSIIQKIDEFQNLSESEILNKLKQEYYELFK